MNEPKEYYDIVQARKLAKDYTNATGVECLLIQSDGIYNPCPGAVHKEFCFQKDDEIANYCLNTHANGAAIAKKKGDCVSYFCPMGLMHWSAPIIVNGQIQGTFIAGHVFYDDAKENIVKRNQLSVLHNKLLKQHPELQESLLSSVVINDDRLSSLKNILHIFAGFLSDSQNPPLNITHIEALLEKEGLSESIIKCEEEEWRKLAETIVHEDPQSTDDILKDMISRIEKAEKPLEEEKTELTNLILTINQKYGGNSHENAMKDSCISAISEIEYIKDHDVLSLWAKKNVRNLLEAAKYLPSIKNADMIYAALHFINTKYHERLTLQEISDYVHFSPPYFSKMFKKELDMTFVQYLTKVRIEKSKDLLADATIPLPEIPGMVGFEEQSYFTKVFRAVSGISPGKYRDQILAR